MNGDNVYYKVAVVSDRGLSEKRPLNEDSYFADTERGLFAVADGVGGANAGEVASSTAMEVLSEAFRHHIPKTDNEDLMELAIQKANASIHQMAKEHPKLSSMATTIVALQLNGNIATLGHVGDSRIYRLTPGGKLYRETRDHSVVEEEVRAGRMTPEQALNHPSRNVISRALGAEEAVEVDMKTIEVVDGTTFLLCSDGITRHISDEELREMIVSYEDLDSVCHLLRSLCYERGAEDNLTAILVRVVIEAANEPFDYDEERTVSTPRAATASATAETVSLEDFHPPLPETQKLDEQPIPAAAAAATQPLYEPAPVQQAYVESEQPVSSGSIVTFEDKPKKKDNSLWSVVKFLLVIILLIIVAVGAFFAGMMYKERSQQNSAPQGTSTTP